MIFCHIALVFIMIMIMTKKVHYHDHYEIITLTFFILGTQAFLGLVVLYVTYGTLNMTSGDVMHHLSEVPCMLLLRAFEYASLFVP